MEDSQNEGLLLDLDKAEGRVLFGTLCDKVSSVCSILNIKFTCEKLLAFESLEGKYYFRYCGLDWVPYRNSFNETNEGQFFYDISAFPKTMFKTITKPAENASALARALGLELADGSENLKFKCPMVNLNAYVLMKYHRLVSFQDAYAKKDMSDAIFIYCNSHTMYCSKWGSICKKKKRDLQFTELERQQVIVSVMDNRVESMLCTPQSPRRWNENDYLARMTGIMYDFQMPKGAAFCENYTMKFSDSDSMDSPVPMLCTFSEVNLLDSSKFHCTFTQVNLFKEGGSNG